MRIKVLFMEPAREFIDSIPEKARKKVVFNINRVSCGEMDKELFKKLSDNGVWEFRTLYSGVQYRLLAFWDTAQNSIVIATNGFIKKTQKTPQKEIDRAMALRDAYFNDKEK